MAITSSVGKYARDMCVVYSLKFQQLLCSFSLADHGSPFKLYKVYLENVKESFEYWAEEYVNSYCTENNNENLYRQARNFVNYVY